jgi:hypothetical protein
MRGHHRDAERSRPLPRATPSHGGTVRDGRKCGRGIAGRYCRRCYPNRKGRSRRRSRPPGKGATLVCRRGRCRFATAQRGGRRPAVRGTTRRGRSSPNPTIGSTTRSPGRVYLRTRFNAHRDRVTPLSEVPRNVRTRSLFGEVPDGVGLEVGTSEHGPPPRENKASSWTMFEARSMGIADVVPFYEPRCRERRMKVEISVDFGESPLSLAEKPVQSPEVRIRNAAVP